MILISSPHLIVVRRRHLDSSAFPETTPQALHDQDQHDFLGSPKFASMDNLLE
jgi:hypothetical protein